MPGPGPPPDDRRARLAALRHGPGQVAERAGRIYQAVLERSAHIRAGNFRAIGVDDLRTLFRLYDAEFFDGLLARMLRQDGAGELVLRLSDRMTRAAGKTFLRRLRVPDPSGSVVER